MMETHTRDEGYDVVIIGAGLSGLSAAYALRQKGIDALILEKEQRIAEPWRKRHPQLHLNTHRRLSSLPGYPLSPDGPGFPSRDEVIGYLERYALATEANIRYATKVENLRRSGGRWSLETSTGTVHARYVIFATGKEHTPSIPDWPGKQKWRGRLIHSAELGDVAQYADKDILVVGAGNSGTDVLNHLARVPTHSVQVSIRHGSTIVPTWFAGFPVQLGSPVMEKLPLWLLDKVLAATEWLAFGDLRRFGIPKRAGGASRLIREGISPAIDRGFVSALKAGDARIVNAVSRFTKDAVVLADGKRLQPQIVIAATGYRTGLTSLLDKIGVLNDRGLPVCDAIGEAIDVPGLWFAGMSPRLTGYFWAARRNSGPMAEAIRARLAHSENQEPATYPVLQAAE
jgi:Pyridine nucleotide-disulphide oxidoreductase